MKNLFITLASLLLSLNVLAVETKVCVFSSDVDPEITQLFVDTDNEGNLDSVRLYITLDKKVVSDDYHPYERVVDEGVVAYEKDGRDIVIFKAKTLDKTDGGVLTINFLYNGLTGERKNINIRLMKENNTFYLATMNGTKFNRGVMIGNKAPMLGTVLGIKEVRTSFK